MKKNFDRLVVGGMYKNGRGQIVTIIKFRPNATKPNQYLASNNNCYYASGDFYSFDTTHYLVEFIGMTHTPPNMESNPPQVVICVKLANGNLMNVSSTKEVPLGVEYSIVS